MQFEVVTTERRLDEIGPAWDLLWQRGSNSVFQSHGWVRAWWNALSDGDTTRLHIGLCWSSRVLVAIIPCATRRHRRVRVLEWAAKECTDYCDALIDPACTEGPGLLEATWRAMGQTGGYDAAYLSHVRPDATIRLLTTSAEIRPVGLRPSHRVEQTLQVQSDGLNGMEWFRALPKKARNNHTRGKRIVGETGPVAVTVYEPGSREIDAVLDSMINLKLQWLESTGRRSTVLENNGRILRSLVAELQQQRSLRVFTITCAGELVAASVNIAQSGRMAAFFAAYDPRFDRASPGTLVMVEYLMWAFDNQISKVDFLCGDEEYKFKFANCKTELVAYVAARTLLGRAAIAIGERLDQKRLARERPVATGLQVSLTDA